MDCQVGTSTVLPHGRKRPANDQIENDQRLAKRFNLLNLDQSGKLYFPRKQDAPQRPPPQIEESESMQLDDTKEKVYIYNLDQELSEIESDEEKLIFLPEIEKKLGKIPNSILTTQSQPVTSSEMILYNVPSSLSVHPDQDNVRKAIIETRARAREKQAQDMRELELQNNGAKAMENELGAGKYYPEHSSWNNFTYDENAMDIG